MYCGRTDIYGDSDSPYMDLTTGHTHDGDDMYSYVPEEFGSLQNPRESLLR